MNLETTENYMDLLKDGKRDEFLTIYNKRKHQFNRYNRMMDCTPIQYTFDVLVGGDIDIEIVKWVYNTFPVKISFINFKLAMIRRGSVELGIWLLTTSDTNINPLLDFRGRTPEEEEYTEPICYKYGNKEVKKYIKKLSIQLKR